MLECLLCLEADQKICIKVGSKEWKELNIEKMIDKYLWSLGNIESRFQLCSRCWKELDGFNSFYTRIEKAHDNLQFFIQPNNYFSEESSVNAVHEPEIVLKYEIEEAIPYEISDDGDAGEKFKLENNDILDPLVTTATNVYSRKEFECNFNLNEFGQSKTDKQFVSKSNLMGNRLVNSLPEKKSFTCNECGKSFVAEHILNQHTSSAHPNSYARVCEICGQFLPDATSFKYHMEKHDLSSSVKCEECGLVLASPHNLKLHLQIKHPPEGLQEHVCHICQWVSPTQKALNKHIKYKHEMGYKFKCTVCEKEFKRSDNFKCHMSIHAGTPLFRCQWCPKEFYSDGNMYQHRKRMHPVEWEEYQRKKYSGNLPPNFKPSKKLKCT